MSEIWPTNLQELLNEDNFGLAFGDTTLVTDMDIGLRKTRRRFTRPIDVLSCSIDLTTLQYDDLHYFYNTTTNGGTSVFSFFHPITSAPMLVKFLAPPQISSKGGGNFTAVMQWEIQP
jgi:hypothetical protein